MNGKILITLVFISALLFIAVQQTPSLLSGQHTFVNISGNQNDISCVSCHPQVADELAKSQIHSNFACEECHRIKVTADGREINYAEHTQAGIKIGEEAHAAYVPRCLDCHDPYGRAYQSYDGTWKTVGVPEFTASSAHRSFVEWANQSGIAVGENEACLACHTNFSLKITYRYFYNISFTKTADWNITDVRVNGTREYVVSVPGSSVQGKHEWIRIADRAGVCVKCHENVYLALTQGSAGTPYSHHTHAPIEIDSEDHGGNNYGKGGKPKDHDWPLSNYWGNTRYHYVADKTTVDSNYCMDCHSGGGHAARKVTCLDCHGPGKPNDPYGVLSNRHSYPIAEWHQYITTNMSKYANEFVGDLCMACHQAAAHNIDKGAYEERQCGKCHGGGYWWCGACHWYGVSLKVNIHSEPSGYSDYYIPQYNIGWS